MILKSYSEFNVNTFFYSKLIENNSLKDNVILFII